MKNTPLAVLACCLFLCLHSIDLQAQNNWQKGYYISAENDTVKGFINYKTERASFARFEFTPVLGGPEQVFFTDKAKSYTIENAASYLSKSFKEKDGTTFRGFFKVIVKGKVSLLKYQLRYFAMNESGDLYEVTRRMSDANGQSKINYQSVGNLRALLTGCSTLSDDELKNYSDKKLKDIFIKYNQCVGGGEVVNIVEDKAMATRIEAGVQVLPSIMSMNDSYPMYLASVSSSKTVEVGAFLSIYTPKINSLTRVIFEANFYQYKGDGFFQVVDGGNKADVYITVSYKALHVPLYMRFGHKYFFDFGIQNHLIVAENNTWRAEVRQVGSSPTTKYFTPDKLSPWTTGLLIGGGATFNEKSFPIRVFARYSRNGRPFFASDIRGYQAISVGVSLQLTGRQK